MEEGKVGRHLTIGPGILVLVPLALMVACEDGIGGPTPTPTPTKAEIAEEAAREWASTSMGKVADELLEFAIGEVPAVSRLAGDVLEEQIRKSATWTFQTPQPGFGHRYDVTATVSVQLTIDLPLLDEKAYLVSLPVRLDVDTVDKAILDWSPNILGATIEEVGE